jgi:YrbI family 3-deoxy-D-manno-octulosonate 8-phosphate phosphatase
MNIKDISLIIYDFDGVMTDNKAYVFQDGSEAVRVNRSDGLAVHLLKKMGIKQIIISTETNPVVGIRAKKIGIPCIQGVGSKLEVVKDYLKKNKINKENVVFMGNEVNDIPAMQYVGISVAPADAYAEVKKIATLTLKTKGGHGVIREFLAILKKGLGR